MVVIECKRPDIKEPITQAVSQQIRNQKEDEIPKLFLYSQILMALSKNEAKYATTGTPAKFWSVWKEDLDEKELNKVVNRPLSTEQKAALYSRPILSRTHVRLSIYWNLLDHASQLFRTEPYTPYAVRSGCWS